jgi:hypothetical protein
MRGQLFSWSLRLTASDDPTQLEEHTMTIRTRTTRLLAAAGGIALALGLAAPASAETTSFDDGADTTASLNDILVVRVNHGTEQLKVKITFTDLRRNSRGGPASIGIFLDTKPARTGPEFRLGSGLNEGTDFQLVRMRNWKPVGDPKSCAHDLALKFKRDKLVFTAARGCIGNPETVRVGAKMIDLFDGSHPVLDWMKGPRRFTAAVASS